MLVCHHILNAQNHVTLNNKVNLSSYLVVDDKKKREHSHMTGY